MRHLLSVVLACSAFASPAHAEPSLERGFDGALRGCEQWVRSPASFADRVDPFVKAVGLGEQMRLVERVEEVNLPPPELRQANRYWRIDSTPTAGYVLVVSDALPMCHITGGGGTDLQPSVESVLSSSQFGRRWTVRQSQVKGDMTTTLFRNRQVPALFIVISRATEPNQRLDRVQVLATAFYRIDN